MSSCVMGSSTISPFYNSDDNNESNPFGTFSEDTLEKSFPFLKEDLNNDYGMDLYLTSPEPITNMIESENQNDQQRSKNSVSSPPHSAMNQQQHQQCEQHEALNVNQQQGDISQLSIDDQHSSHSEPPHPISHDPSPSQPTQPALPQPAYMPYGYQSVGLQDPPLHQHPTHYHPYRFEALNSPRFNLPRHQEPISPLSTSPHGSTYSGPALSHSPPTAISPSVVSPASAIGSMGSIGSLSDTSPQSGMWQYPLPGSGSAGAGTTYNGTPLNSISNLPSLGTSPTTAPGLSMVSGFPYTTNTPISKLGLTGGLPGAGRATRTRGRYGRGATPAGGGKRTREKAEEVKKEDEGDSDLDLSDAGDDPESGRGKKKGALGFHPDNTGENLDPLDYARDAEQIRKARIKSEQKRRDELREGFKRLREALPHSNTRASKVSILDRSVAHIQQIEGANHYLLAQLEQANQELQALRISNADLVRTVTGGVRAGTSSAGSDARQHST